MSEKLSAEAIEEQVQAKFKQSVAQNVADAKVMITELDRALKDADVAP